MNQIITASDKCSEELKQVRDSESPKRELILTGGVARGPQKRVFMG